MLIHTRTAALPITERTRDTLPVAIVMPYNPKMTSGREQESRLKCLMAKMERELLSRYTRDIAMPVIRNVQRAVKSLNGNTHRSSVAIFVTGSDIHTLYMDMPVEETLIIDTPFALKDILDCRIDEREFLVLALSSRNSRVYVSTGGDFRIIKSNTPANIYAYLNEVPTPTANFSDPSNRREVMLDKFLRHIDEGLDSVLAAWPRPVFVIGEPRVAGHFKSLTRHGKNIVAYIHQDPTDRNMAHWKECLGPWLAKWEKVRETHALQLVEKATDAGKLVAGIAEVARQARCHNCRLLVVEKSFTGTAGPASTDFYLTDPADQIIWQVLSNGGNVERVEKDSLRHLGGIALVKYY
jgi:Bacterial archaeo-eukaryotic release factor family 3